MDNPVQVQRSTGLLSNTPQPELRSSLTEKSYPCRERVELLRSSLWGIPFTPCCTSFARGYPRESPTD
jgi:hypothetical protein